MKNSIKILSCNALILILLILISTFFIYKISVYAFYNELYSMVLMKNLEDNKSKSLIDYKINSNIDNITNYKLSIKDMSDIKTIAETIYFISFFSPEETICKQKYLFKKSKNKKIQEYIKNECHK